MGGNWWIEIVFLAMMAGFIALRLVSVLGRRTGNESPATGEAYRGGTAELAPAQTTIEGRTRPAPVLPEGLPAEARDGLTAIAALDPAFDAARFLEGARGAYGMILGAFWSGDLSEVEPFVSDEIGDQFKRAIAERAESGSTVDNRVVGIDDARIIAAHLDGTMAEVVVRIDAAIAGVTRDAEGRVIGGSPSEAVHAKDEWTFRRHVSALDPNWLLVATEAHDD